ncbi:MAG: TolC family protein [Thermodesulfovibrionales bacterium]|jgi:outer membrane protein TolC
MKTTKYRTWIRAIRGHLKEAVLFTLCSVFLPIHTVYASDETLNLNDLIGEALKNNHEILISESKIDASGYRIPQVKSLPDPLFSFGYQNVGFGQYTYGKSDDAWWAFSASQMFPFPGKLSLKGEMAAQETESLKSSYLGIRLMTIEKVKEVYYDLFLAYKDIDLIRDRTILFSRIEDAAVARYSSGMGVQQEVLMAQAEKYMLLEKEEMMKQKIQSVEAMLNATIGRDVTSPLGRPVEVGRTELSVTMDELLKTHVEHSPFVEEKAKMVAAAEAKVKMAEKEYYPDFTINAGYFKRGGEFEDMWSLTTAINIPIFYKTKQRQGVLEAKALLLTAEHELVATKIMLSSTIRDNYSMMKTAERLMELYKEGLIPKTYQDFESALAGYATGKVEALTVISRLKTLLDYDTLYWGQFIEREKAIARLQAIADTMETGDKDR